MTRPGVRSILTVSPPSTIWTTTSPSTASAVVPASGTVRRTTNAANAVARTSTVTDAATRRCAYSISTGPSRGGISRPWQSGQSGQAMPDPLIRTNPPSRMSTYAAIAVATARIRYRCTAGEVVGITVRRPLPICATRAIHPNARPWAAQGLWLFDAGTPGPPGRAA